MLSSVIAEGIETQMRESWLMDGPVILVPIKDFEKTKVLKVLAWCSDISLIFQLGNWSVTGFRDWCRVRRAFKTGTPVPKFPGQAQGCICELVWPVQLWSHLLLTSSGNLDSSHTPAYPRASVSTIPSARHVSLPPGLGMPGSFSAFWFQLTCHLLREAFTNHPLESRTRLLGLLHPFICLPPNCHLSVSFVYLVTCLFSLPLLWNISFMRAGTRLSNSCLCLELY